MLAPNVNHILPHLTFNNLLSKRNWNYSGDTHMLPLLDNRRLPPKTSLLMCITSRISGYSGSKKNTSMSL